MLYISCKPTSLARDLVEFAKYGYRVEKVCCVDMFPGTVHVETVVLLSQLKQKPDISQVKRKCGIEVGKNLRVAARRMDCLQGQFDDCRDRLGTCSKS